jgi:hypothetical protein
MRRLTQALAGEREDTQSGRHPSNQFSGSQYKEAMESKMRVAGVCTLPRAMRHEIIREPR